MQREKSEKRIKRSSLKILKIDSVTKRVKLFVLGFREIENLFRVIFFERLNIVQEI